MILTYQYTPSDLVEADRLHRGARRGRRLIGLFCAVPVLLGLAMGGLTAFVAGAAVLLLLLLLGLRRLAALRRARRLLAARPELREGLELELSEQGMRMRGEEGWSALSSWREGPRHFLLYSAPQLYHAVPRRALEDAPALRAFLQARAPEV